MIGIILFLYFQGDVIHAVIWKSLIDSFKSQIKENYIYTIKNFKVQQETIYRPIDDDLKIVFIYSTKIKEVTEEASEFPKLYFELATVDVLQCDKFCILSKLDTSLYFILMHIFQMLLVYLAVCQIYNREL
jgi:hypothetical protein